MTVHDTELGKVNSNTYTWKSSRKSVSCAVMCHGRLKREVNWMRDSDSEIGTVGGRDRRGRARATFCELLLSLTLRVSRL
jgi:hypothetical protein